MNFGITACRRIEQAAHALITRFQRHGNGSLSEEPLVLAVTYSYPIKVVLYAAAFHGGWKLHLMKSLGKVLEAAASRRPKAVVYDHRAADPAWHECCSALSREGVPFVSLAPSSDDETFLTVVAAGGYQAHDDPLTSEGVVDAVDFAEEIARLAHVPVV